MQKQLIIFTLARIPLLLAFVLIFSSVEHRLTAQIPNNSFENWADCIPEEWATPNVCGLVTAVSRSSTASDGSWAARGEVVSFIGTLLPPTLQSGTEGEGFPITERHGSVEGMYMFEPVDGDRFGVNVIFYKGENVIAQGAISISAAASTYTPFSVPMNYVNSEVPDRAIIQFIIFGPETGGDVHLGSVMHVDALAFGEGGGNGGDGPVLQIERSGNQVVVSWPTEVTDYRLQSTPQLANPTWTDVTGVSENKYEFTPTSQEYFRLIKPL